MNATEDLRTILDEALSQRIVHLERRPFAYRSSFGIEELEVVCADGSQVRMIFKDTCWESLSEVSRQAKPRFLYHPAREIETYRRILASRLLGTARCYAAVADSAAGRYWLFLEKLPEVTLYQTGEKSVWEEAARWLAGMHRQLREEGRLSEHARNAHLLVYDGAYYREWIRRACAFLAPDTPAASVRRLKHLEERYDRVVEVLCGLPVTFLHGEFYASNILVRTAGDEPRICPIDWELAAVGPGLLDLAALIAGSWTRAQKTALALAYQRALAAPATASHSDTEGFLTALDWCSLHLAVQWLGWSPAWTPPAAQAQDWLSEALGLMDRLGL